MASPRVISLHGEVNYPQKIALPSGCTLTVTLSDSSRADASERVIATYKTTINQNVSLPFLLEYDTEERGTRTLSARIEYQGRLHWISDTMLPIELTREDQTGLNIRVVQVAA